jgi:hypothetical protein
MGFVGEWDGHLEPLLRGDAVVIREKNAQYRDSWLKRGGVGAYMMLARKWDRIEVFLQEVCDYDLFDAFECDGRDETVLDDVADLRRYLAIVEAYYWWRRERGVEFTVGEVTVELQPTGMADTPMAEGQEVGLRSHDPVSFDVEFVPPAKTFFVQGKAVSSEEFSQWARDQMRDMETERADARSLHSRALTVVRDHIRKQKPAEGHRVGHDKARHIATLESLAEELESASRTRS